MAYQKLMDKVKKWAEQYNFSLEMYDKKKRLKKCVAKTFHGAGIMAPFNTKTKLGYRHLIENDGKLLK